MAIEKPTLIEASPFMSAKWDELTDGRTFAPSDVPTLTLLCQWYGVVDRCMEDIAQGDGVQVAYMNDMGDIKALPQLATMKQASAEIRALNKQLGINDEAAPAADPRTVPLYVIQANRQSKSEARRRA